MSHREALTWDSSTPLHTSRRLTLSFPFFPPLPFSPQISSTHTHTPRVNHTPPFAGCRESCTVYVPQIVLSYGGEWGCKGTSDRGQERSTARAGERLNDWGWRAVEEGWWWVAPEGIISGDPATLHVPLPPPSTHFFVWWCVAAMNAPPYPLPSLPHLSPLNMIPMQAGSKAWPRSCIAESRSCPRNNGHHHHRKENKLTDNSNMYITCFHFHIMSRHPGQCHPDSCAP